MSCATEPEEMTLLPPDVALDSKVSLEAELVRTGVGYGLTPGEWGTVGEVGGTGVSVRELSAQHTSSARAPRYRL